MPSLTKTDAEFAINLAAVINLYLRHRLIVPAAGNDVTPAEAA